MINEELAVQIEQDLLTKLDEIKKEKGLTDVQWGDAAFQGEKNGRRKVQNLKHAKLRLRVGDFLQLCTALEVDPARIIVGVLDARKL